jgi:hypothetical protein
VRKKIHRTPVVNRRVIATTTEANEIKTSTNNDVNNNSIDYNKISKEEQFNEEIGGILPALTSVMPRKTQAPVFEHSTHAIKSIDFEPNVVETSSIKPSLTTSFEKILEHQYKIKGLDKDYEDEKLEEEEEEEKLIGVLGSQVLSIQFN